MLLYWHCIYVMCCSLCVRVVKSLRAGMGKTLYKKRQVLKLEERLKARQPIKEGTITTVTVTLYEKRVQPEDVAARLLQLLPVHQPDSPMVIHLDISYEVCFSPWLVCLFLGCLASQEHAGVSQGQPDLLRQFYVCHTEIEVADQTVYLTQSQYTDTRPTSPCADPIMPSTWQGNHWSANFEVTGMTRPGKNSVANGIWTPDLRWTP